MGKNAGRNYGPRTRLVRGIYARIFCESRSIFPSPEGARKNKSNEQNVRTYFMLNHTMRCLLFHLLRRKKNASIARELHQYNKRSRVTKTAQTK